MDISRNTLKISTIPPMISVVIPAFNEAKDISHTLDSLSRQKTTQQYEVIVVDNNSTDDTSKIVRDYKGDLNLSLIHEKKKGRSPARRAGFAKAKGEIIFSTDADTIVPDNWIEDMVKHFSEVSVIAITGRCTIHDSGWFVNTFFNAFQPFSMVLYRCLFGHYWLSGFNFAIRKSIYEKSGGFNPDLNSQEDTELSFRVKEFGTIRFIREPSVVFSGRRFQKGLLKAFYEYISSWIFVIVLRKQRTILSDIR